MSKRNFKKLIKLPIVTFVAISFVAVFSLTFQIKASANQVVVSRIATGSNGKSYVEVDGKPFMYENVENMGSWQLKGFDDTSPNRYSTPLPQDWLENDFEKTKNAGYSMISCFLNWNDIEPITQGVYDWTLVDKYITWANKYGLRLSFTWMGSDANGGTRLPGYGGGWSCTAPLYLQDQATYWNQKGTPPDTALTTDYMFYATKTGTAAAYMKSCEISAMSALFDHLASYDTNHRLISIMIDNEMHNLSGSWVSDVAAAVKNSNYVVVVGQHQQKGSYHAIANYDFVGFDDYGSGVSGKMGYLLQSPTPLRIETESGGDDDNLSSNVLAAIANGGWLEAWELNDAFGNCYQDGMYETPNADYANYIPDYYVSWQLGTMSTLRYGPQKNKRLQQALSKAYWVVAQASSTEMLGFNLDTNNPVANYSATKTLNGHSLGFKSDGGDSKGYGSNGLIVNKDNSYYCLSDTGTTVTFYSDIAPTSATYGYQDENGNWVSEGNATVTDNGNGTWGIQCTASQVIKLDLPANNVAPVFSNASYTKTTKVNTSVSDSVSATDSNYWDTITFALGTSASHGTAVVNSDGSWTYNPVQDYTGTDSFTVTANDGNGGITTATVNIVINLTMNPPVFASSDYNVTTSLNTVISSNVSATDMDIGDVLTYSLGMQASHGIAAVSPNGNWVYNPTLSYTGTDSFTVTVSDGNDGTATTTVKITVNPNSVTDSHATTNLALNKSTTTSTYYSSSQTGAKAVDGSTSTQWTAKTGTFPQWFEVDLGNIYNLGSIKQTFGESDGSTYKYLLEGSIDNTNWTTLADRTDTGITCASGSGKAIITESVSGKYRYIRFTIVGITGALGHNANIKEFEVYGKDNAPLFGSSSYSAEATQNTAINGSASATDEDTTDNLTYTLGMQATHGTAIVNVNGSWTYIPAQDYVGNDSFMITVADGNGGTATAIVNITITTDVPDSVLPVMVELTRDEDTITAQLKNPMEKTLRQKQQ